MKKTDLQDALTNVGDDLVRDASECGAPARESWFSGSTFRRIAGIAAVAVVGVGAWLFVLMGGNWLKPGNSAATGTPAGSIESEADDDTEEIAEYTVQPENISGETARVFNCFSVDGVNDVNKLLWDTDGKFTIPGIEGVEFRYDYKIEALFANDEEYIGGEGYSILGLFYSDFTGDGVPELIVDLTDFAKAANDGLDYTTDKIQIIDYTTGEVIFSIEDESLDYHLFMQDGKLYYRGVTTEGNCVISGFFYATGDPENPVGTESVDPIDVIQDKIQDKVERRNTLRWIRVKMRRYGSEAHMGYVCGISIMPEIRDVYMFKCGDEKADYLYLKNIWEEPPVDANDVESIMASAKEDWDEDAVSVARVIFTLVNPPILNYDINGSDTFSFIKNGEDMDVQFRLWDPGLREIVTDDLYGYLNEHPGAYCLEVQFNDTAVAADGITDAFRVTDGVLLIVSEK